MAVDPKSLEKLNEYFANKLEEEGKTYDRLQKAGEKVSQIITDADKVLKNTASSAAQKKRAETDLDQATRKLVNTYLREQQEIRRDRKTGEITAAESKRLLAENEAEFQTQMAMLGKSHRGYYETIIPLTNGLERLSSILDSETTRALKSFAANILTAGTQSQTGLEARISFANTFFDTVVKIASSAAGAIPIIGNSARELVQGLGETGRAVLDFYGKEAVKLADSLRQTSNAGIIFADGLTGLRTAATDAGLTTNIFAKALLENREAVMQFGGNLTEGARRIGRVTKELNVDRLQQLGYGLDEIPGLIAEVGARMRRSGSVTDAEVAKQTQAYAQNLKLIAELTGQDAKTLQAKRDANERDLAFQQFLADKTPEEAEAIRRQMELLPSAAQDLFKEMAQTGGQIFSESGNILAQQAPAIAEMARRLFSAAETGGVTKDTSIEILKDLGTTAKEQISSVRDFARAAAVLPEYQEVGQKLAESFKTLSAIDFNKIDTLIADLDKAGRDDPASKLLREEERKGMAEMVSIQNLVNDQLSTYLGIVRALNRPTELLLEGMQKLSRFIDEHFADADTRAARDTAARQQAQENQDEIYRRMNQLRSGVNPETTRIRQTSEIQQGGSNLNPVQQNVGTTVTRRSNVRFNPETGLYENNPVVEQGGGRQGYAEGGIVSGPTTGFPAMLHGEEAVIPLPDGIDGTAFVNILREASSGGASTELIRIQQSASAQQGDLLTALNNKIDQLIEATRQVANYTELTSARVA